VAHSTWIALGLIALFFVYVTAKGELSKYLSTVFGQFPTGTTSTGGAAGGALGALSGAGNLAGSVTNLISAGSSLAGGGGVYGTGGGTGGL
jgi:hypothetical protein